MSLVTSHWSLDPALVYVVLAGGMYALGGADQRRAGSRSKALLQEISFYLGLAIIVIALDSSIDYYSDELFWVHMVQHILLLEVAPALMLMGRPWPRMWRSLPLSWRTAVGRWIAQSPSASPIRALVRPPVVWAVFCGNLLIWHIPFFYNLTLEYQLVHYCEHALFFFTGLLFWAHVIDPGPLRQRLSVIWSIGYVVGAMVVSWMLAVILVLAPDALYSHYAAMATRPGGLTALGDQQVAGGMMWVPGSVPYALAVLITFQRWASPDSAERTRPNPSPAARASA